MAGARVERSAQDVLTYELFNPDQTPVPASLATLDVLPAASVTASPLAGVQIRAGYGRTVSRPDFRELSPATFNDVTGGRQVFGNPELRRARIDHVDVRVEWFPTPGEVVSVGAFAKRLESPVETVIIPAADLSSSWSNVESATNLGLELEVRQDLPLNLFAAGNLAVIRSRVVFGDDAAGIQTSSERPLQGQSPYALNAQLGWAHPDRGDGLTVLVNLVGRRIVEVGALGLPDALEYPAPRLDLVARAELPAGLGLSLKVGNALNSATRTTLGGAEVDRIRKGFDAGIGLSWSP
jgi:outer membrane receptor protein involved in Fe transport